MSNIDRLDDGVVIYERKTVFADHNSEEFKNMCNEFDKQLGRFEKLMGNEKDLK